MEEKFIIAWEQNRKEAEKLGVRMRPVERQQALQAARRMLSGNRDSEGFGQLQKLGRLELSLEALAIQKAYTALFSDDEVNNALMRLLDAGYKF